MQEPKTLECPACHACDSSNFAKEGMKQLYQKKVQRYRCKLCGRVFY